MNLSFNKYETVRLAYLNLIENKSFYKQLFNIDFISEQVILLDKSIRQEFITDFSTKYMSASIWIDSHSLFHKEKLYYNDNMFKDIYAYFISKNSNKSHIYEIFSFLICNYHPKFLNLKNIQKSKKSEQYYYALKHLSIFIDQQFENNEKIYSDISKNHYWIDLEREFQDHYLKFKRLFSAYIVSLYVYASATTLIYGKNSNRFYDKYHSLIENSNQYIKKTCSKNEYAFYIEHLDLYNVVDFFDACQLYPSKELSKYTKELLMDNNVKLGLLGKLRTFKLSRYGHFFLNPSLTQKIYC